LTFIDDSKRHHMHQLGWFECLDKKMYGDHAESFTFTSAHIIVYIIRCLDQVFHTTCMFLIHSLKSLTLITYSMPANLAKYPLSVEQRYGWSFSIGTSFVDHCSVLVTCIFITLVWVCMVAFFFVDLLESIPRCKAVVNGPDIRHNSKCVSSISIHLAQVDSDTVYPCWWMM
jgi:hypothetical protein